MRTLGPGQTDRFRDRWMTIVTLSHMRRGLIMCKVRREEGRVRQWRAAARRDSTVLFNLATNKEKPPTRGIHVHLYPKVDYVIICTRLPWLTNETRTQLTAYIRTYYITQHNMHYYTTQYRHIHNTYNSVPVNTTNAHVLQDCNISTGTQLWLGYSATS